MGKLFNVNAACIQELHYMVDISDKLEKIKSMVDAGQYFTINRARQYIYCHFNITAMVCKYPVDIMSLYGYCSPRQKH